MEWTIFFSIVGILISAFVASQVVAILFLLKQNEELQENIEDSQPPF